MKTEKILSVLRVLAWMGMIGYAVNLGSQAISFGVSFVNPVASQKIYGVTQDLSDLRQHHFQYYVCAMSFVLVLSGMFVYLWYSIIKLLSKINLENPFTFDVAKKFEKIAYWLFDIWLVALIGRMVVKRFAESMGDSLDIIHVSNEFLFSAGIVYVISQIFKHGVELKQEQDLTI